MPVPSGTASLLDIQNEFGGSNPISLSEYYSVGPGPASGVISINTFRGASNSFTFAITANQTNANLRTLAVAAGWNQSAAVQATINSGVVITGSVAGNSTAALTIDGAWAGGVTLINNGTIRGRGGNGGRGAGKTSNSNNSYLSAVGAAGGRALLVSVACTIQNNGAIQGGAGGGGGGGAKAFIGETQNTQWSGGSGGGGGGGGFSSLSNSAGGGGGLINWGSNKKPGFAGAGGTYNARGAGGASGNTSNGSTANQLRVSVKGGAGGIGGNLGAAGSGGAAGVVNTTNNSGSTVYNIGQSGGGAAGQAVSGNSNITWTATGTRTGPVV